MLTKEFIRTSWLLLFSLIVFMINASAQTPTATILIRPEFVGERIRGSRIDPPHGKFDERIAKVSIDGEEAGEVTEGKILKLPITRGEHIIEASSPKSFFIYKGEIKIENDDQRILKMELVCDYRKLINAAATGKLVVLAGNDGTTDYITTRDEKGNSFFIDNKLVRIDVGTKLTPEETILYFDEDYDWTMFKIRYLGTYMYVRFADCRFN
jgi:hypothetical protein